jgi:Uncharacterized conserved protein
MNTEIIEKLDELIAIFENSEEIKRIEELKEKIYSDKLLKHLLDEYKKENNEYSDSYIKLKREIINNDLVSEYRELENKLYFLIFEINKKLSTLTNERSCFNENN